MSSRKTQKELQKERWLKRHKKKNRPPAPLPRDTVIVRDYPEKMSEIVADFVEPYLDQVSSKELQGLYQFAAVAWNMSLFPAAEREKHLQKSMQKFPAEARDQFRTLIEPMIQRKLTYFADHRRLILGVELTMRPSGPYLQITSTLPMD